jgi:hypothetical protein
MARKQSRRSVSIPLELYDGLAELATQHVIPLSQLACQAIAALLAGAVGIGPARSPYILGLETYAKRAEQKAARRAARAKRPPPPAPVLGNCANCSARQVLVTPTRLDPDGPTFSICAGCNTEAPPDVHIDRRKKSGRW